MMGSLAHAVSLFSRLLPAHVQPPPRSVTNVPNRGLAMIFDQGIGVGADDVSRIRYSLPSVVNPPSPFQKSRLSAGEAAFHCGGTSFDLADGSFRNGVSRSCETDGRCVNPLAFV